MPRIVLILIVMASVSTSVRAQQFADVPTDHWAFDAVAELATRGLIEGFPDGTFRGDKMITRFEMAALAARLLARIDSTNRDIALLGLRVRALEDQARAMSGAFAEHRALIQTKASEEELRKLIERLDRLQAELEGLKRTTVDILKKSHTH